MARMTSTRTSLIRFFGIQAVVVPTGVSAIAAVSNSPLFLAIILTGTELLLSGLVAFLAWHRPRTLGCD